MKAKLLAILGFLLIAAALLLLQVWSTIELSERSNSALRELGNIQTNNLTSEKQRQETVSLRLDNEKKAYFWAALVSNIGAAVGVLAAIVGAWLALNQYLDLKQKERLDRAAQDIQSLWSGITSGDPRVRAGSVVGLQHFLSAEKSEYHPRIASALALVARLEEDPVVIRTLTPVIEQALAVLPLKLLQSISWQRLKLYRANLEGANLSGFDLRDCILDDANLRGANLVGAQMDAARLNGADLSKANLDRAKLTYADLGKCSFREASLIGADLLHAKVLNADFELAALSQCKFSSLTTDWRLTRNWRKARFDKIVLDSLIAQHGPAAEGIRVLMLMWEFSPLVSGGGWTACFHLVKKLRKRGAVVTLVVPWPQSWLSSSAFGNEVEVIGVGPDDPGFDPTAFMAYGNYGSYGDQRRTEGSHREKKLPSTKALREFVAAFGINAVDALKSRGGSFDIIHAHDWLTFSCAELLGPILHVPWVAHFHSTEADRRADKGEKWIENIEALACKSAACVVVNSRISKQSIVQDYKADPQQIRIVPNVLSEECLEVPEVGSYSNRRVTFIGRYSMQKGPDKFVEIARIVRDRLPSTEFVMYGAGDSKSDILKLRDSMPQEFGPSHEYNVLDRVKDLKPYARDPETGRLSELPKLTSEIQKMVQNAMVKHGFIAKRLGYTTFHLALKTPPPNQPQDYVTEVVPSGACGVLGGEFIRIGDFVAWENRVDAFDGASAIIVPSRSEPFGMVILEAMLHGIPVLFTSTAGVAEFVNAGTKIDPEKPSEAAESVVSLLTDRNCWETQSIKQLQAVRAFIRRDDEAQLMEVWRQVCGQNDPNAKAAMSHEA